VDVSDFQPPRPATTRSQILLQTVSEMAQPRNSPYQQTRIQMRTQGDPDWAYTLFASDSPNVLHEVARREVDIATLNPAGPLAMAYRGKGPFKEPIPVRAITVIPSTDWLGFAVNASTGITSLADIKAEKYPLRISVRGQRDHSTLLYFDMVLGAYGFSLADIEGWGGSISFDPSMPYDELRVGRLERGEVDAIWDESMTRFVAVAEAHDMRLLALEPPILEQMTELGFRPSAIPGSLFSQPHPDVPTLDYSGWPVFTHADVDDDFVYDFCRSLDARKDQIAWQQEGPLPLHTMCRDSKAGPLDIPLHPAAERYWRDVGYLD
jgi:TRAP-type uncharacterized transport system substrate-binding protein